MKLLGWMHRKFRQNNGDTGRELATASACLYCLSGRPSADNHRSKSPPLPLPNETEPPEQPPHNILYHGLLHIGTFGSPVPIPENEPSLALNEIAEKGIETTTTESDLMAISAELEKVIAAESEKEMRSGERRSSASARPSYAGSSGKISEVCPLQDFLFGAAVEALPKQRRGSLGELFMRTGQAEEGKREDEEILMPRFQLEEMSVGKGGAAPGRNRGGETKLQNILRIFQRKIHPDNSITSKKFTKPAKYEINRDRKCFTISKSSRKSTNDYIRQGITPKKEDKRKSFSRIKECRAIVKNNSTGSREQWIKTDADYLVLEL